MIRRESNVSIDTPTVARLPTDLRSRQKWPKQRWIKVSRAVGSPLLAHYLPPPLAKQQEAMPVPLPAGVWELEFTGTEPGEARNPRPRDQRFYWLYQRQLYSTTADLIAREVLALLTERQNRVRARIDRAVNWMDQAAAVETEGGVRKPIPDDVKVFIWQRDRGQCVECGGKAELEFDHIIPLALGGSNTKRNIQLLCADCNRRKGANI